VAGFPRNARPESLGIPTNPREMGRILLRTIVRGLIKEEKIDTQILSPINIVDLENVDQAMNP
jgi:hypothetical protein